MLELDTLLADRYQITYRADEQPECMVYRALDTQTQQPVLLAALPHPDARALAASQQIARVLAGIQSAGLLAYVAHWNDDLTLYLAVADPGGQDISRAVHEGPHNQLTAGHPREALAQTQRLLGALETLHSQVPPLLLGDAHPADLWAAPNGELWLAPFALLRPVGAPGTPYRAPELEDAAATPTPTSDLYIAGVVCYHLLTGWLPPTPGLRLAGTPLNAPRTLQAGITPLVERMVLRALAMEPGERYQHVAEFQQALVAVSLLDEAQLASPAPSALVLSASHNTLPTPASAAPLVASLPEPDTLPPARPFSPHYTPLPITPGAAASPAASTRATPNTWLIIGTIALALLALVICVLIGLAVFLMPELLFGIPGA